MVRISFFVIAVVILSLVNMTFLAEWGNEPHRWSDAYLEYENLMALKTNPLGVLLLLSLLWMGIWFSYHEIFLWVLWSSVATLLMLFGVIYTETVTQTSNNVLIDALSSAGGATLLWFMLCMIFTGIVLAISLLACFMRIRFGFQPHEERYDTIVN